MTFTSLLALVICGATLATSYAAPTSAKYPATGSNYALFKTAKPPLVPMPQQIDWTNKFTVLTEVSIHEPKQVSDEKQMNFVKQQLEQFLTHHEVKVSQAANFAIVFKTGKITTPEGTSKKKQEEAYSISINAQKAVITSESTKGFFYGLQTLKQLIIRRNEKTTIALCSLTDWPDLEVRGFMNDVGRNFMPIPLIIEELEAMANLKFNVYHLHFTEYPGWRLESKIYPELNDPQYHTRKPGKFYTQQEFKDLVEYCRLRNITVIPEMDMPGHSDCFMKALKVKEMKDPKATEALVKLIDELCTLAPKEHMPYIHIGTDEVRRPDQQVTDEILKQYFDTVEKNGRTPVRWHPGLTPKGYNGAVQQLWTGRQARRAWPTDGSKYIDSLETYLNHIDPFETAMTFYFRRPCPFDKAKAEGLGFILCSWPDLEIEDERNQLLQTPIYPGMGFASESLWNNPHPQIEGDPNKDELMKYFSNLPPQGDPLLKDFADYENRVLAIRDRFFVNKEFSYVRQANIPWKIIGPFPHDGDVDKVFPPEEVLKTGKLKKSYDFDGKNYEWLPDTYTGGTIIFKHYCNFPTLFNGNKMGAFPHKNHTYYAVTYIYSPKKQTVPCWISGHTWATSDWSTGPASVEGKWFHANPKFYVNGKEIPAPEWQRPNNNKILIDENYHFRKPSMISLNKGWNQVFIKSPNNDKTRRWMFTFVPVKTNEKTPWQNVKEFPGLKFSVSPSSK